MPMSHQTIIAQKKKTSVIVSHYCSANKSRRATETDDVCSLQWEGAGQLYDLGLMLLESTMEAIYLLHVLFRRLDFSYNLTDEG